MRPTSVEPVNAILSIPGCSTSAVPVRPSQVTTFSTPAGRPISIANLGKRQRSQRRILGRLDHDCVAGGQRRRHLPRKHQQRKIPRDNLAHHAARGVAAETRRLQQLRPARHGHKSAALPVEYRCRATRGSACHCPCSPARPAAASVSTPAAPAHTDSAHADGRSAPAIRQGRPRGRHRAINFLRPRALHRSQQLPRSRILHRKRLTRPSRRPGPINIRPKRAAPAPPATESPHSNPPTPAHTPSTQTSPQCCLPSIAPLRCLRALCQRRVAPSRSYHHHPYQ